MKLNDKLKLLYKLEKEILEELDSIGNDECKCDNPETFKYIHEGNWDEVQTRCINCGGCIVDIY